GTRSTITVFRRGQTKDLSVTVAEIEPDSSEASASQSEPKAKASPAGQKLGLTVAPLTEAQRKKLGIKGGVRVEAAVDAAARAGLREGDVILSVANTDVASLKDFEAALSQADKSKAVNVRYRRGEWEQYALIRPAH
ncbi:MAG: PDZ domain-containing protein, partial [Giesbergeria sp.]